MCTDAQKVRVWNELRQCDLKPFARFLSFALVSQAARGAGVKLGRGPLHLGNLVWLALGSALHTSKSFADILVLVLKIIRDAPDWDQSAFAQAQRQARRKKGKRRRHDPRGNDPTRLSEEAFVQARRKMPWSFWVHLLMLLTDVFEDRHGQRVRWKSFRLLALDGTCINLPSWKRLREHFGTASNGGGKRRRKTQARMVMLQLPLVRLPWRYELTPLREGEKTVAGRLLKGLRGNDLVLMDRGFWSYGLFWQIQHQQAFFAIRQVAQVRLKTIGKLGHRDRLVRYQPRDPKRKWRALPPAIELRAIDYQIKGFRRSTLITSMTDPTIISRDEWIQMATVDAAGQALDKPGLYHRRWEIETTFRELKVTQGLEGGLRSRTPNGIRYEVAGHVLLYLLVRWLIVEAADHARVEDPLRISFAHALQEFLDMRIQLLLYSGRHVKHVLLPRLLERIANHRVALRPGRHYPRPNDTKRKNKGHGRSQKPSKLKKAA
jgi:Transposase DDE domain